jgi:hypothetical protein
MLTHYKVNYLNSFINSYMSKNYYVYAYLRSKDSSTAPAGTPYYIGKGSSNRAYAKHNAPVPTDKSNIVFLKENLSEVDAHLYEMEMIATYGRKDIKTGILHNRTNGGEGNSNPSEITRKKMAHAKRNESEETHKRRSEAAKNRPRRPTSEETKRKISEANLGRKRSDEAKAKMSAAATGRPSSKKGVSESKETRVKKSISAKNRWAKSNI